jgi:hypothetical protein
MLFALRKHSQKPVRAEVSKSRSGASIPQGERECVSLPKASTSAAELESLR